MPGSMLRALSKPAGLPVFPPHTDPSGDCLLRRLLADEPERAHISWPPGFEGGIAHRLDVSTSGAVAVADTLEELQRLRAWFSARQLTKTYLLRAARAVPWSEHRCDRPIAHDRRRKKRMIVQRGANTPHRGKWHPASTQLHHLRGDLWQATMRSGVMHQIRVHAAFLGLPLLGDRLYGGGPTPPEAPPGLVFFLHHVGFEAPGGLSTTRVAAPAWACGG